MAEKPPDLELTVAIAISGYTQEEWDTKLSPRYIDEYKTKAAIAIEAHTKALEAAGMVIVPRPVTEPNLISKLDELLRY